MSDARTIVFDVNETLSDLSPLGERLAAVGASAQLATVWFAALLRDGFALAAGGEQESFAALGAGLLDTMLAASTLDRPRHEAVAHVMEGLHQLDVHPDVASGVRALTAGGARLVTLTNGAVQTTEELLGRAGLRDAFSDLLSVEDAGIWKPAPGAYAYAANALGCEPSEMVLVAVHPWDIHGAARAGLRTAWINRDARPYPAYFRRPDFAAAGIAALADQL